MEFRLDLINLSLVASVRDLAVVKHLRLNHFILALVSAFFCLSLIWIGVIGLSADFLSHFPVAGHPATPAAVGPFVAVNAFLLGKADWLFVILNGLHSLLDSGRSKGPAGAAVALVLNITQVLGISPIDVVVLLVLEETSTIIIIWFDLVTR